MNYNLLTTQIEPKLSGCLGLHDRFCMSIHKIESAILGGINFARAVRLTSHLGHNRFTYSAFQVPVSDSTLRFECKLFHRLRSGAYGTSLAESQRKASRGSSAQRSASMPHRLWDFAIKDICDGINNFPALLACSR